ncbi:MAG TPA: sulfate ABC transporter permease subunit [Longimicrobium sp.]|nr:sulfate ABC transporter permease subunit [Longimicrobium sp.]
MPELHVAEPGVAVKPSPRPSPIPPARVPVPAIARPRRRIRWARLGGMAVTTSVLLYLALVLVIPLGALLVEAARAGAPEAVRALAAPEGLSALLNSLLLVMIALAVNGTLGIAGAIVLVRHRFRGRRLLDALVDLPLALSPVMAGLAVLLLFGRSGWLDPLLRPAGIRVAFAFPGMVICTLLVTLPFTIREVGHVLEELGTGDEEAAATLGATPWQTFWRVTLPNVRRGLTFGLTLTAARALGEFGAVLVVGGAISGRTQTATTFIYAAAEERNTAAAYGTAALIAAASMLLLLALQAVRRHSEEGRDGNPG